MKTILLTFISIILFVQPVLSCEVLSGKVVGVKDGDTIEILVDNQKHVIRFAEVDAPEKKQPFGKKAKQFVSGKIFGKKVKVVTLKRGRYGRRIGEVFYRGVSVNEELIASGLAWQDPRYSKSLGIKALQQDAIKNRQGLWVDPSPVSPWEWRKNKKNRVLK